MRTLYIHIGTHKTGTSSFQQTLRDNSKDLLLKDHLDVIDIKEQDLPFLREVTFTEGISNSLIKKLEQFIERKSYESSNSIIMSWEGFAGDPLQFYKNNYNVARILYEATKNFRTIILIVLRRQDEFVQSMYTQKIHEGIKVQSIENFIKDRNLKLLDWIRFLTPFLEFFGRESVHVYPFDKEVLKKYSIVQILNRSLKSKVLADIAESKSLNIGYSYTAMKMANACNPRLNEVDLLHLTGQ